MPNNYDFSKADFSGWATKYNIKCTDGRTIMHNAFKDCDGKKVPLMWNHQHNDPGCVVGYAILEHHDEGMRTYGYFNGNDMAKYAREDVVHGDVDSLSIYANQLKQQGGNVMHGNIREVSLVLAGANIGAYIDNVAVAHGDDDENENGEAYIYDTNLNWRLQYIPEFLGSGICDLVCGGLLGGYSTPFTETIRQYVISLPSESIYGIARCVFSYTFIPYSIPRYSKILFLHLRYYRYL